MGRPLQLTDLRTQTDSEQISEHREQLIGILTLHIVPQGHTHGDARRVWGCRHGDARMGKEFFLGGTQVLASSRDEPDGSSL